MSKLKLDERVENAVNAFFDLETEKDAYAMTFGGGDTALANGEKTPAETADGWINIARQVLLFVPGALLLYLITLAMIEFYPEFGITVWGVFFLLSGAFLCYAASGKLTETRNLVVPGTIMGAALLVAGVAWFFPTSLQPDIFFWYSIYFFPVALIASKLMQMWAAEK